VTAVRARVRPCLICGGQSGGGAGCFLFPYQSFHRLLHTYRYPSSGAGTVDQIVADVSSGLRLTPPQEKPFISKYVLKYLTPWTWALLGKLSVAQLLKNFSKILWNPKDYYRDHYRHSLLNVFSQINPIHTIPPYLSKIHLNSIQPTMSWSS
jgi:hypothetical protein